MAAPEQRTPERSSMGRGIDILACLAELSTADVRGASVQQVARSMQRDRSQISRTLAALASEGIVYRGASGRYRLAWSLFASAAQVVERRLRTVGLTVLDDLAETVGEACFLGVLRGDATVTIAESVPTSVELIGSWVGRAYPAFYSDAGQAVLWDASEPEIRGVFSRTTFRQAGPNAASSVDEFIARLADARARGYSVVSEEAEPSLFSVAAPVWDFRGEVVAAVQIVGEKSHLEPRTAALGSACIASARVLSSALGGAG